MDDHANVTNVDEPKGLIESKASEDVPRSIVTKCGIAYATK